MTKLDVFGLSLVQGVVMMDRVFGEKVLAALSLTGEAAEAFAGHADMSLWQDEDTASLVAFFRAAVSETSAKRVARANSALVRKINGARTALDQSEDCISQAANSLIELIDRIMRESFSQAEVMAWVEDNFSTTATDWSFPTTAGPGPPNARKRCAWCMGPGRSRVPCPQPTTAPGRARSTTSSPRSWSPPATDSSRSSTTTPGPRRSARRSRSCSPSVVHNGTHRLGMESPGPAGPGRGTATDVDC
ncbi:hypothetical protein [Streptodolium elevatio]